MKIDIKTNYSEGVETATKNKDKYTTADKAEIHRMIADELNETYKKKNSDYGDSFANLRKEIPNAILVRIYDKYQRLKTLLSGKQSLVTDESIDDTFKDLANYCIMEVIERKIDESKNASDLIEKLAEERSKVINDYYIQTERVILENGKYEVVLEGNGKKFYALRHGEEWRDLTGDNLCLALLNKILDLETDLRLYKNRLAEKADAKVTASSIKNLMEKYREELHHERNPMPFAEEHEEGFKSGKVEILEDVIKDLKNLISSNL